jgi:mannose-6-phosphate isomerase-like protein (cupin superfamily)
MGKIAKVNTARFSIAISRDLSMSLVEHQPGPPALCDRLIVTIADMTHTLPHGGELHPDGDELIYIVSGKVRVIGDSAPDDSCELGSGEACIVSKGEWHLVQILEPTRLVGITPGPGGSHRPVEPKPAFLSDRGQSHLHL